MPLRVDRYAPVKTNADLWYRIFVEKLYTLLQRKVRKFVITLCQVVLNYIYWTKDSTLCFKHRKIILVSNHLAQNTHKFVLKNGPCAQKHPVFLYMKATSGLKNYLRISQCVPLHPAGHLQV